MTMSLWGNHDLRDRFGNALALSPLLALCLLFALATPGPLCAAPFTTGQSQAPSLSLGPDRTTVDLAPYLEILEAPKGVLTLEEVVYRATANQFLPLPRAQTFFLGDPASDWWLRATINVGATDPDSTCGWVADAGWPDFWDWYAINVFDVYLLDFNGEIHLQRSAGHGDVSPFIHRLNFPKPGQYVLLLHVQSELPLYLPLKLESLHEAQHSSRKSGMSKSLICGMLLAMVFIHAVLFVCIRDKAYLWYSAFILACVSYISVQTGLMREFLPQFWSADLGKYLDPALLTLLGMVLLQFARVFLATYVYSPVNDKILKAGIIGGGLWLASMPLLDLITVNLLSAILPMFNLYAVVVALRVRRKGFSPANHFILCFFPFALGGPTAVLTYLGLIEFSRFIFYLVPVMSMTTVLLFPYALTRRLAHLRIDQGQIRRKRREADLRAMTDSLTGLPNLRLFQQEMGELVREADQEGEALTLVILDMDDFKRLNNELGTLAGDEVLRAVGRAIRVASRESDHGYRSGGEEFSLLLPGSTAREGLRVCERIRESLSQIVVSEMEEGDLKVTMSAGVAEYASAEGPDSLLFRASRAMHRAKADGRDTVVVAD